VTVLRRMRWWDLDQVLAIEERAYPEETWSARAFWSELGQVDTRHYVVAVDGDRVVGYAGLCDYPDEAFVQTVAVAPEEQGRGIGEQLLLELLAEADRRRKSPVALEVRADNERAQRLYARHGFRRTGVRRGYYQPSGTDAWVMSRG
jgi:[ribosomal protein S18]-alanine N-acetyltransferase